MSNMRNRLIVPTKLLAVFVIMAPAVAEAQEASFRGLGFIHGNRFGGPGFASSISPDGTAVVGDETVNQYPQAFLWTDATGMIPLGNLQGFHPISQALGVSDEGRVVVGRSESPDGREAFRWTAQTGMIGLGDFAGGVFQSGAWDITADGSLIVGIGTSEYGKFGFTWTEAGGMERLLPLNHQQFPNGQSWAYGVSPSGDFIAGKSEAEVGAEAVLWDTDRAVQGLGDFAGGNINSRAYGVSDGSPVVVGQGEMEQGYSPFVWTAAGGFAAFDLPPGWNGRGRAFDVSADGRVIVGEAVASGFDVGFVWTPENGIEDIRDVLTGTHGLDLNGWRITSVRGVSADGSVFTGAGIDPNGVGQAWIAVIPRSCIADLNEDGTVDSLDFLLFLNLFVDFDPVADFNGDGFIDTLDFLAFLNVFSEGCA